MAPGECVSQFMHPPSALATVEAGERLFKACVAEVVEDYRRFVAS